MTVILPPKVSPLLTLGMSLTDLPGAILNAKAAGKAQARAQLDTNEKRQQAKKRYETSNLQLESLQRQQQQDIQNQPLQNEIDRKDLESKLRTIDLQGQKLIKNDTFNALDIYFQSKDSNGRYDLSSMNNFLSENKNNEYMPVSFKNIAHVTQINPNDPEDRKLLKGLGVPQLEFDKLDSKDGKKDGVIDWPKFKGRLVKVVKKDGTVTLEDMLQLAAETGYSKHAQKLQMKNLLDLADLGKAQVAAQPKDTRSKERKLADELATAQSRIDNNIAVPGDVKFVADNKPTVKDTRTPAQKNADILAEAQIAIKAGTATPGQIILANPKSTYTRPTKAKQAEESAKLTTKMQNIIANPDQYTNNDVMDAKNYLEARHKRVTDTGQRKQEEANAAIKEYKKSGFDKLDDPKSNDRAGELVRAIERVKPLGSLEEKRILSAQSMLGLASGAAQVKGSRAGIIDASLKTGLDYVSNNTEDDIAINKYKAFFSILRNKLYGSALTAAEIQAFADAYGTANMQLGPMLAGIETAIIQIRDELKGVKGLSNDIVFNYHTNNLLKNYDQVVKGLDERLAFLNDLTNAGDDKTKVNEVVGKWRAKTGGKSPRETLVTTPETQGQKDLSKALDTLQ